MDRVITTKLHFQSNFFLLHKLSKGEVPGEDLKNALMSVSRLCPVNLTSLKGQIYSSMFIGLGSEVLGVLTWLL